MENSKIQTLKEIHLAIESVEEARTLPNLTKEEKLILESFSLKLSNIEQSIIKEIGENLISKLTTDTKELDLLADKLDKSSQSLEKMVKTIGNVTKVVNVLIKVVSEGAKLL